ncbi:MAG: hypothetical protein Q4C47_07855, partial [Planctomycetia bacterium]|nr:hypothetical protein [Planctomycetia bacterium]
PWPTLHGPLQSLSVYICNRHSAYALGAALVLKPSMTRSQVNRLYPRNVSPPGTIGPGKIRDSTPVNRRGVYSSIRITGILGNGDRNTRMDPVNLPTGEPRSNGNADRNGGTRNTEPEMEPER